MEVCLQCYMSDHVPESNAPQTQENTASAMVDTPADKGEGPKLPFLQRPGLDLSLRHYDDDPDVFPNLCRKLGDTNHPAPKDSWRSNTFTIRERAMLWFMDRITDKPSWNTKVFDDEIVGNWKAELESFVSEAAQDEHSVLYRGFTGKMFEYCLQELRDKAKIYEKTGAVSVFDGAAAVLKADNLVSAELKAKLRAAVKVFEDVPEDERDWHPESNDMVLDLVHPSLFALVYGKTRVLKDRELSLETCLEAYGSGEVLKWNHLDMQDREGGKDRYESNDPWYSSNFQWLPCEVEVTNGKPKIISYINNVHPVANADLYPVIEGIIETALPFYSAAYNRVMAFRKKVSENAGSCFAPSRLEYYYDEIDCHDPVRCETVKCDQDEISYICDDDERARALGFDPDDEDVYLEDVVRDWFTNAHPTKQPEAPEYSYKGVTLEEYTPSKQFTSGRLQAIVKLATIHLTPHKPEYAGGGWHIEGLLNEHICATALYYYDSENISESTLAFRTTIDIENWDDSYSYEQNSDRFEDVYGISPLLGSSANRSCLEVGATTTPENRLIVFPNVYQHRVSSFELADKTKPGHRKILAIFLVDPATPIISTSNVPPQQRSWGSLPGAAGRLPAELANIIAEDLDCPYDFETAKKIRIAIMNERKVKEDNVNKAVTAKRFSFCEH